MTHISNTAKDGSEAAPADLFMDEIRPYPLLVPVGVILLDPRIPARRRAPRRTLSRGGLLWLLQLPLLGPAGASVPRFARGGVIAVSRRWGGGSGIGVPRAEHVRPGE